MSAPDVRQFDNAVMRIQRCREEIIYFAIGVAHDFDQHLVFIGTGFHRIESRRKNRIMLRWRVYYCSCHATKLGCIQTSVKTTASGRPVGHRSSPQFPCEVGRKARGGRPSRSDLFGALLVKRYIGPLFGSRCRPHNRGRVIFESFAPTLDIGHRIAESLCRVNVCTVAEHGGRDFGHKFFARVVLRAEKTRYLATVCDCSEKPLASNGSIHETW